MSEFNGITLNGVELEAVDAGMRKLLMTSENSNNVRETKDITDTSCW